MKKRLLPFLFFALTISWNISQAQIYVNHAATGANDGTSWPDAYTDLQDALANDSTGDTIRVAQGTYLPGTSPTATFLIDNNIHLLGGYDAGGNRDPGMYETILSGDLNGDDVADDFENYRSDNSMTVVHIFANVSTETLIDGFTVKGGQADGTAPGTEKYGGGMYCTGRPIIRQCIFEQNFATDYGGGLYVSGVTAQGVRVEQCHFEKNKSSNGGGAHGGGMFVLDVKGTGFYLIDSEFDNNTADWGSGVSVLSSNGTVEGTTFTNNSNTTHGGGMRVAFQDGEDGLSFQVLDCTFENNQSTFGGGVYFLVFGKNCTLEVANSNFIGNAVKPNPFGWVQAGGGLCAGLAPGSENSSLTIDNCLFHQNTSTGQSSALGGNSGGTNNSISVSNCIFRENENTGYYGTIRISTNENSTNTEVNVENCVVENNIASSSNYYTDSGLDLRSRVNSGPANFTVRNCQFLNNQSTRQAGGMSLWGHEGSSPTFTVEDCLFEGNSADWRGGALWILPGSENFHATLNRCQFLNNSSPWGSAIGTFYNDSDAPFAKTGFFSINNSLITGSVGGGAAIAVDSFSNFQLLNTTVADNQSDGIWLSDSSGVILQNSILHNPGFTEFQDQTNNGIATSLGGNLFSDDSFDDHDLTYDFLNVVDPGFVNPDTGNYRLLATSLAIDNGVDLGNLPATDLDSNDRPYMGGCVDIGAYEAQVIVSSDCVTDSKEAIEYGMLLLFPNPASDVLQVQLPETIARPVEVSMFDAQGKLMVRLEVADGQTIGIGHFPNGFYSVKLTDGERVYVGKFVKQ